MITWPLPLLGLSIRTSLAGSPNNDDAQASDVVAPGPWWPTSALDGAISTATHNASGGGGMLLVVLVQESDMLHSLQNSRRRAGYSPLTTALRNGTGNTGTMLCK